MNKLKYIIVAAALAAATITGFAQSAPTAPKNTGWVSSAALGFSLAAGNTENLLATGNLLSSKKWERNEVDLGLDGNYGKTGSIQSVGNIHGFGQYNRLFTGSKKTNG